MLNYSEHLYDIVCYVEPNDLCDDHPHLNTNNISHNLPDNDCHFIYDNDVGYYGNDDANYGYHSVNNRYIFENCLGTVCSSHHDARISPAHRNRCALTSLRVFEYFDNTVFSFDPS